MFLFSVLLFTAIEWLQLEIINLRQVVNQVAKDCATTTVYQIVLIVQISPTMHSHTVVWTPDLLLLTTQALIHLACFYVRDLHSSFPKLSTPVYEAL